MLELYASTNQTVLPPPGDELDALADQILSQRIDGLLLVQAAQRDTSIVVTEEEIAAAVDNQVARAQANFTSRAQFEAALAESNLTLQEYRNFLTTQVRQERLIGMYLSKQQRERGTPPVSDKQIQEWFDQQVELAGGAPMLPPSLTFDQIVIPVTPSDTALARARAKADSILSLIRDEDQPFDALARRFSEDEGSAALGGDLGWFRPGNLTIAFENAVYSQTLRPGGVTGPVLTPFGFHIIKLERVRGPERNARHILIQPGIYEEDVERARELATRVAGEIREGVAMDSLRRAHGDRDAPSRLGPVVRDSMPAEYRQAIADAGEGDVVGPFSFSDPLQKFGIVRVEVVEPERSATVEDYRAQAQAEVGRQLLEQELLEEMRSQTYIDIRLPGTGLRR
jgi:peptidyl-prolyl cis-trans isomerase SurA